MFSLETTLELINNLDHRSELRKFAPQWAIVVVNSNREIVGVHRFKTQPTVEQENAATDPYRNCTYFFTNPNMYVTLSALRDRIDRCVETLQSLPRGARKP